MYVEFDEMMKTLNGVTYFDKGMDDKGCMRCIITSAYERFGIEEPELYINRK